MSSTPVEARHRAPASAAVEEVPAQPVVPERKLERSTKKAKRKDKQKQAEKEQPESAAERAAAVPPPDAVRTFCHTCFCEEGLPLTLLLRIERILLFLKSFSDCVKRPSL